MVTIYDADGNALSVEPVDARESVETGRYTYAPPAAQAAPLEPAQTSGEPQPEPAPEPAPAKPKKG